MSALPKVVKQASLSPEAASAFLPYGRQLIEDDDIDAVVSALRGDMLTTGPYVPAFEQALAERVGASEAVACSNGTAALYMAAGALGLGQGSTIVVPSITFLATASAPHLVGASIIFSDVDPETGLMRASDLEAALTRAPGGRADAVFPVHYAGQSCDMPAIAQVARAKGMTIVEDAAHALGTALVEDDGVVLPVGSNAYSDLTIFSFHPVKTIAMGEGGAVTANTPELITGLRRWRNHGMVREADAFVTDGAFDAEGKPNPWYYEMAQPGHNFRISDINCALGLSQLKKLERFVAKRRALVAAYDNILMPLTPVVRPIARQPSSLTAWHLYPVKIDFEAARIARGDLMRALAAEGIGTQVHYIPVHRQPFYASQSATPYLPGAEAYYSQTLSLPLHAAMTEDDVSRVCESLKRLLRL